MASTIDIQVNDKELNIFLDRLSQRLPNITGNMGWNITEMLASSIRQEAGLAFSFPRPYLQTTIKPEKTDRFNYQVKAARHWSPVEYGRRPGKNPPVNSVLERWAKKARIDPFALSKSIGEKGTTPHPFVEPGFIKAQPRIEAYIERESRRLVT